MIYTYGIKIRGSYHEKDNTVCQDAYTIVERGDGITIAAVADGLGSAARSDIASQIAVDVSTSYCEKHITQTDNADCILEIIQTSFAMALDAIEEKVEAQGHELSEYDTTLTLAVLLGDALYYGHAGDSGMIALTSEGLFEKVTEQQRDEEGHVFPLFYEDKWMFQKFDKKACSVLLATDGMLLPLFPMLIRNASIPIHISLAGYFMDCRSLRIRIDTLGADVVKTQIEDYIKSIPNAAVGNDDKTIVVLANTSADPQVQPADYYKEPDWAELKRLHNEEYQRSAFPHIPKHGTIGTSTDKRAIDVPPKNTNKDTGVSHNISVSSQASADCPGKTRTNMENSIPHETETKPPQKKGFFRKFFGG